MGDINAVHGTLEMGSLEVSASSSDVELIDEPKYVSLDDRTTQITLPDDSQYIVVTKIGFSMTGTNSFFLHGGESPTPVQVGPTIRGAVSVSDVLDVHLTFPMGAPVRGSFTNEVGKVTNVWLEYHVKQTQNRTPTNQDYA